MRSQTSRAAGGGASGSSSSATPAERTANDDTSGSQSEPSLQSGCGWRHSHSPSATSRSSTVTAGEATGPDRAPRRTRAARTSAGGPDLVPLRLQPDGRGAAPAVAGRVARVDPHADACALAGGAGHEPAAAPVEPDAHALDLAAVDRGARGVERAAAAQQPDRAAAAVGRDATQPQHGEAAAHDRLPDHADLQGAAEHDVAAGDAVAPVDPREVHAGAAVDVVGRLVLRADHVVAVPARDHVLACAAAQRVVAGPAVDVERRGDRRAGGVQLVVAAVGVEIDPLARADVDVERAGRGRTGAVEADPARGRLRRRDLELLAAGSAVDLDGVEPVAALVDVVVVARVPDHRVVARPAERAVARIERVVVADDPVVAVAAGDQVRAVAAVQRVVAGSAVDVERDRDRRAGRGGERVVAAVRVEVEPLARADVEVEPTRDRHGTGAVEDDAARDRGRLDLELLATAAAVDLDGVAAVAALVDVVAVAGVPDHRVVAGAAERAVARIAGVVVADDAVVAVAAGDEVGGVAAVERGRDRAVGGHERVIAAVGVQVEPLARADVEVEPTRDRDGTGAVEHDAAGGRGRLDLELLAAAAAVDLDRVGALAALHQVVVVTRVPYERVVAGLAAEVVAAAAGVVVAEDAVGAGAAVELVGML